MLKPKIIIATNIEFDHPDVYENFDNTKGTFLDFFKKLSKYGFLIANADNKNTLDVAQKSGVNIVTYGKNSVSDYQIKDIKFKNQKTYFDIYIKKKKELIRDLIINIPGEFNIANATAAFAACDIMGIDKNIILKGLLRYLGCRRRFEDMGSFFGAKFYDDYAHHPGEIKATLKAAKEWFPGRRIIVIFQPHTYSRTKALLTGFSKSFDEADMVGLMDIYASAREKLDPEVNSALLSKETTKYNKNTFYIKDHKTTLKWISGNVKAGDVVITMGAGDIFHLYEELRRR